MIINVDPKIWEISILEVILVLLTKSLISSKAPAVVLKLQERGAEGLSDMVFAVHGVHIANRVSIVVQEYIDEFCVHGLVERDGHWGVTLHPQRSSTVEDRTDCVSREGHRLVPFGEDLHSGRDFISVHHFAFVALKRTTGDKDRLSFSSLVSDETIELALLVAQIISTCVVLREGLINELEACVHNLVVLDRVDAEGFAKQVHVGRLLDQDEQSVFENGTNLTGAAEEGSFGLDRLDKRPCSHSVVILVRDDGSPLDPLA